MSAIAFRPLPPEDAPPKVRLRARELRVRQIEHYIDRLQADISRARVNLITEKEERDRVKAQMRSRRASIEDSADGPLLQP